MKCRSSIIFFFFTNMDLVKHKYLTWTTDTNEPKNHCLLNIIFGIKLKQQKLKINQIENFKKYVCI